MTSMFSQTTSYHSSVISQDEQEHYILVCSRHCYQGYIISICLSIAHVLRSSSILLYSSSDSYTPQHTTKHNTDVVCTSRAALLVDRHHNEILSFPSYVHNIPLVMSVCRLSSNCAIYFLQACQVSSDEKHSYHIADAAGKEEMWIDGDGTVFLYYTGSDKRSVYI